MLGLSLDLPYICTVTTIPLPCPGIDIEEITPCRSVVALVVVIKCLVVVLAQNPEAFVGYLECLVVEIKALAGNTGEYLGVKVPIPGKDFGVPIPS